MFWKEVQKCEGSEQQEDVQILDEAGYASNFPELSNRHTTLEQRCMNVITTSEY